MPTFKFSAQVTVSAFTVVEADTLEEAMEEAESREVVIGAMYSAEQAEESWVIDDADGSAENIRIDDERSV